LENSGAAILPFQEYRRAGRKESVFFAGQRSRRKNSFWDSPLFHALALCFFSDAVNVGMSYYSA
jgi:hypothetical protein